MAGRKQALIERMTKEPSPLQKSNNPNQIDLGETLPEKQQTVARGLVLPMKYMNLPLVKSDQEAQQRIEMFFQDVTEYGVRPTIELLGLALGGTRHNLYEWESGRSHTISSHLVKKAKEYIASFDAQMVSEGRLNPVTYIFRSKNYYGLKDTTEHVVTADTGVQVDRNALEEEARLLEDDGVKLSSER